MSTRQLSHLLPRGVASSLLAAVLMFQVQILDAAALQIQFTGLDIEYDGLLLTTVGDPDPLKSVTLRVDGSLAGPTMVDSPDVIFAQLAIAVKNIPASGGFGITDPVGSLDLGLNTGGLGLILEDASVQFLPTGSVDFIIAGSLASIVGQDLPYGLMIDDPVTVSFSTQITPGSLSVNPLNNLIDGFTASGTGEISGAAVVPVPPAVWLLSSGLISLVSFSKRKKTR